MKTSNTIARVRSTSLVGANLVFALIWAITRIAPTKRFLFYSPVFPSCRLPVIFLLILYLCFPHAVTAEPDVAHNRTEEVLKKESYYHFFLEDYLTSATRLKLIEEVKKEGQDQVTLNEVRLLLGSLYLAWGMDRPATVIFNELVEVFPPGSDKNILLLQIERMQYGRSLYGAATKTYQLLTPDEGFARMDQASYLAGMSHNAKGSIQEGIRILESIPPRSPYFRYAKLALSKSYVEVNDPLYSLRLLRELDEIDYGENPLLETFAEKGRLTRGLLLIEENRFLEAERILTAIPQESPFYPDALFSLGWTHFNREQYLDAILSFQDLIQFAPEHPYAMEARTTVADCYSRLGAHRAAIGIYGEALAVYDREGLAIENLRGLIEDEDRLAYLLHNFEQVENGPLASLLEDEGLRSWVREYGELGSLEAYLKQKHDDMGVFRVMVGHREEVFRRHLPTVNGFLEKSPIKDLQEKLVSLQSHLDKAIEQEEVRALVSKEEGEVLNQLEVGLQQSTILFDTMKTLPLDAASRHGLENQYREADRWLKLYYGELFWKVITEVPGRVDDLRRVITSLKTYLEKAAALQKRLVVSVPSSEGKIAQFRKDIEEIRLALLEKRVRTLALQKRLLPRLQAKLLQALDDRMGHIGALASRARLSQLRIMDAKSKS